ncbi:hypothetical protein GGTG_09830 [Gaeumannomyces tritici R3-111a-1]|uniref:Uncharacterized protein n=1 Tax=Gaeumannomyces tritici (strain R3-111a-1) TaxID=644352 RepID=J3P8J6_GAET3|nr:hypothetical protein GGTG_09830 [Gaeumannomyces tritici R3-111a-1]EJT72979.1 hypothetical protein GGTG_09830 [Gaeumannomyces tritici R3-111a-1]
MLLEQNPSVSLKLANLALLILFLVTAVALSKAIYNVYFHPLAGYPGPVAYRASEIPRLIQEVAGNTVHKWTELHAKYGPVVRIAPGQLSYISNDAWRDIYAAKGTAQSFEPPRTPDPANAQEQGLPSSGKARPAKAPKARQMSREEMTFPGDDFEFFGGDAKPMISCDPVNHARHRRIIGSAFSDPAVRAYEPVVTERTTLLLTRLEEHSARQQAVDIVDWFNFAMFDITSTLYAAYRSPVHFADPLAFVPERWMAGGGGGGGTGEEEEEEAGRFAGDNVDVFRPFSYGPRNCVGQNLALLEVRHVIARLYWRFDVEVLPGQESWAVSQKTYLSWVKPPLLVRLRVSKGAS